MAKVDFLNIMYSKNRTPLEFHFDNLMARPILTYISMQDIEQLRYIAMSNKLSAKPKEKYKLIDSIMRPRGFRKFASGTNRVIYKCLDDTSIIIKIAIDSVGMRDNPCEYKNQFYLKPFVTKCFEVSPCGTVGLFERVEPITSIEEFKSVANDVFDLLTKHIIGVYVLEDIGSKFFMNYGLRKGFGPVLLDFPYMYELDGNKLYCNAQDPTTSSGFCDGTIDYDIGFNNLVCEKCGKRYLATELKKCIESKKIIIKDEGDVERMKFKITQGDQVILRVDTDRVSTDYIEKPIAKVSTNKNDRNNYRYDKKKQNNHYNKKIDYNHCSVKITSDGNDVRMNNPVLSDSNKFNQGTTVDTAPVVDKLYSDKEQPKEFNNIVGDIYKKNREEISESLVIREELTINPRDKEEKFLDENGQIKIPNEVIEEKESLADKYFD